MNLYEINNAIMNCIDEETGEILDEAALKSLQMEKQDKIKNVALWVKNLKADAAALKSEADNLTARRKSTEKKIKSLTDWLTVATDGKGIKDVQFVISFRKSTAVNILDEDAIPDDYLIFEPPKIDKAGIKDALKAGNEVAGAALEEHNNISVR